ncbi:ABC transporter permease [Roseomonas sp. HJA6]|uniref:ABC transporter permease n=1 Tax=Roseomonas alba TaxID=2846776 RepID=A0ABS7AAD6_9PROT|nr:ABC transporter permease [Neoroseomonas alba]MBW6399258.1 ABC transporter permease [Neoroseomonas alba]
MSGIALLRRGRLWRLLRDQGSSLIGGLIVAIVLLTALLAPWIAPRDPVEIDIVNALLPPDAEFPLGTDQGGRDVLSRIIWGTRVSLTVSLLAVVIGVTLGTLLGLFAAYHRGSWIEQVLMRLMDMIASIPLLIWAIALVGIIGVQPVTLGPLTFDNEHKLLVLIGLLYVPSLTRVTHAVAQAEMSADYVRARQVEGASPIAIVLGDVLPNCLSPIMVQATLLIAAGIVVEASVSFIGLGVQPPRPSWGSMLADARNYVFSPEWWLPVFPGIAISLTVIGFNLLGDGLRDVLDPRRVTRGLA